MGAMSRLLAPLLCLALGWPTLADAAQRWFDIELVIFARDGLPTGNEVWPEVVELPETELTRPPAARAPLRLGREADRLRRQPGYRVLLHTAWRQPTGSRERAPWIRLSDGGDVSVAQGLDGMARLSLRRYLHLDLDLVLSREMELPVALPTPQPVAGTVAIPLGKPDGAAGAIPPASSAVSYRRVLQPFRLVDSRRMRSDELHYIDHPTFGVLALATVYQPPVPEEPAVAPPAAPADGSTPTAASGEPAPATTATPGATPAN